MGYGYDANFVDVIEVDDGKWKAMHHETPSSVQVFRPALGCLHNLADQRRTRLNEIPRLRLGSGCGTIRLRPANPASPPGEIGTAQPSSGNS
jgi:hypothetical protein